MFAVDRTVKENTVQNMKGFLTNTDSPNFECIDLTGFLMPNFIDLLSIRPRFNNA